MADFVAKLAPVPIAIIGMACRLPGGADSPEKLWSLLSEGRSGWREIPPERWNAESFYNKSPEAKESLPSKCGYFLQQDISNFDAGFFGIPAYEAHGMDPQQRILLEVTYEAIESAGIPVENLRGSDTSVFVGIFERDYDRMGYKDLPELMRLHVTGAGDAIMSNRISYCFDLKGASLTIDTGCSGSLVALHQACQSLRTGESKVSIVGGSQLLIHPDLSIAMSSVGLVNPDGKCYPFDSRGTGYGRSEGVGVVILKRLDYALADGDHIHAVIPHSGINQDGKTSGISVPNGEAQAALIKRVYAEAGLNPAKTVYVEAHGTGTKIGDEEEIMSISKVFIEEPKRDTDLYVGSIKGNIGHLEASSGIAGLIKLVLVLRHGHIPPNLNFEKPKPFLKLAERRIKIPDKLIPLPTAGEPNRRRVSLNSFGYGGTNCHVILEPPSRTLGSSNRISGISNGITVSNGGYTEGSVVSSHQNGTLDGNSSQQNVEPQLFVLSASSEKSLLASAANLKDWLLSRTIDSHILKNLAYTLGVRRSRLPWRCSAVASDVDKLTAELGQIASRKTRSSSSVSLIFIFTGQGAQWYKMGRELIASSKCFSESIKKSDEILRKLAHSWNLIDELSKDKAASRLGEAEISQPATTAIQIALVDLLSHYNIIPSSVIGHSSGEIGAAYAAGALDHESAILVAYNRGLVSSLATNTTKNKGSMMAVGIGEDQILPYLKRIKNGVLTVACVNSPTSITVSGDQTAIDELKNILDQKSLLVRKVRVDTAYHSHHMKEVGGAYLRSLDTMSSRDVRDGIAFYSTVTGLKKVSDFDPAYWTENLVSQVKFSQALQTLRDEILKSSKSDDGTHTFVEIGPHSALAGPVRQTLADKLATPFQYHYMSALVRDQGAVETILALAGRLFELGYALDFRGVINDAILKPLRTQMIVDLQPYPWDHDKYWHESRLSKSHRFRQFPYHDLCGLLDPMSSSLEPRWRYHANLNALPWLKDHVVDNFIIYPGAGYICMAVEAMKQLVEMRKMPGSISKYILRNVAFRKFIIIPEHGEGGREPEVEIMLTMTPSKAHDGSRWETFRICSYGKDEQWSENCAGLIAVDMTVSGQTEGEFEGDCNEEDLREADNLSTLEFMQQECVTSIDPRSFYQDMRKSGNDFGPNFALINKAIIHDGSHIGVSELTIPDISTIMPYESSRPHVVHPAVFDASQQLSTMLFKTFLSNSPCVPVTSTEIQISADITSKPGDHLIAAHEMVSLGPKSSVSNSLVFQRSENGSFKTVIRVKNGQTRAIGEVHGDVKDMPYDLEIAHKLAWEVDSDFLTDNSFQARLSSEDVDLDEKMFEANQAAAIYLHSALRGLETGSINVTMPHLEKYVAWMRKFCNSDTFKLLTNGMTPDQEHRILASDDTWEKGVDFQMLSRIGKNLPQILAAKADPLALMLEDGLLYQIYDKGTVLGDYEGMKEFLKILSFKKPHLSYIEIGAGTGGATTAVLEALGAPTGRIMLDQYHYTDISAGFFDAAGAKFAEWTDYIEFKTLDIEKDPVQQGFAKASYDVVVASNVLHATKDMDVTMSNVRTLLRPGGTLLLLEVTHNFVANNAVFGTLPGWWAFEDAREDTPLLSKKEWNALLIKHSFSGIDLTKTLTMVSRAVGTEPTNGAGQAKTPTAKLLKGCTTKTVDMIIEAVETASRTKDLNFLNADWEEFCDDQAVTYVVFDSTSNPLLLSPTQYKFDCLQAITNSGNNILWVTVQEDFGTVASSFNGLAEGLGRVLRRENVGMKFVTFNIQRTTAEIPPDWLANAVLQVAESCFWPTNDTQRTFESEFTYRSGEILIPRVETDPKFVTWVHSSLDGNTNVDRVRYRQLSRPLKLHVESPGLLSSLRFVDDEIPSTPLGRFDIQISPHAYGVNFKDVFIALGQMLPSVSMVGEVSGTVTAVGETMKDLYEIGDRVTGLGAESFANHARINGNLAHKIADSMSFTVGATIPAVYLTAYYCLVDVARLQKGQSILIHAASGGVGQAAIQIAQHTSATIFATVGSAVKRQLLVDHYGIPQSHIFSSRSRSFKDGILRLTKDIGVDVVLNSLSGEILSDSMECVKVLGTFVEIGKADIYKSSSLNMAIFDKSITFAAVDLVVVANANPVKIHETFGKVMELFDHGALYPVQTINKFPIGDVEDAFRMIAARRHTGKVVLVIEDDSMVKATPTKPAPLQLRRDGTYVIAGGLGDLGRRSARFMAEHGAGHVVTLSRRAIDNGSKEQLINEMKKLGAQLHIVKCDIADEKMLRGAAEYCSQLPPVCGILHAGMVLRDHPFSHMTLEDWVAPLGPKVLGTINLDKVFASPHLEFFVCLSSVSGVMGRAAQSNYAAGNCFQDAFARAQALNSHTHYTSIDVGAIQGSESVAQVEAEAARTKVILMSFSELFKSIEYCMSPQARVDGMTQQALGFSRESMIDAGDEHSLEDPFFARLPYSRKKHDVAKAVKVDISEQVRQVKTLAEADRIITDAMVAKFAVFLNMPSSEIKPEQSLSSLGLDSLVSIELKNWMVRTFHVPLQTSELTGAASILALSSILVARSKLINHEIRSLSTKSHSKQESDITMVPNIGNSDKQPACGPHHGYYCCRGSRELPRYPLVALDEAVEDLINDIGHFATSPEEADNLRRAAQELIASNSLGRNIYNDLVSKAEDPEVDSWIADFFVKALALKRRYPIAPYSNFLATHYDSKMPHTQAERAAVIAVASFQFKQKMDSKELDPDYLGDIPLCDWSWRYLFNTVREPHVRCDKMSTYSGEDFCAVIRRGHVFKVPLRDGNGNISYYNMKSMFEELLKLELDGDSWIGILTTDDRDAWARNRETLLSQGHQNDAYFKTIERAVFTICLDHGSPTTREDRVYQGYIGDGFNRWHDKSIQYIVTANGRSGQIYEHSMIDGVTTIQLVSYVQNAIFDHTPRPQDVCDTQATNVIPEEYILQTTPNINAHIQTLRESFVNKTSKKEYSYLDIPSLGMTTLLSRRVPSKPTVDLAIQVASRLYFGHNPASWETVSTSHFHRGRPDIVHVTVPSVLRFCSVVTDPLSRNSLAERRAMLLEAAQDCTARVHHAAQGKNYFRLMDVIEVIAQGIPGATMPALFSDPVWQRVQPRLIMQSIFDGSAADVAYNLIDAESIWIAYAAGDDFTKFSIVGPKGKVAKFQSALLNAAEIVGTIIDADET